MSLQIFMIITVDCAWGDFEWTPCSVTCGNGTQNGIREPATPAANGGKPCPGSALTQRQCAKPTCPPPGEK